MFAMKENVLITGATRGIGRELAIQLCELGYSVFGTGRDQTALDQARALIVEGQSARQAAQACAEALEVPWRPIYKQLLQEKSEDNRALEPSD